MTKIDKIETTLYRLPLPEKIESASSGVLTAFDMVMVRVWDKDGTHGCGYTPLFSGQGPALVEIINNVCAGIVMQEDPSRIEWIWHKMWRQLHYAGRGAPVGDLKPTLSTYHFGDCSGVSIQKSKPTQVILTSTFLLINFWQGPTKV